MIENRVKNCRRRQIELDFLRIFAMFAVVMVHTCGMKTHDLPLDDSNWQILTFIAGLMTWQIPSFVMISGRFFLDPNREVPTKRVIKAIIRLCVAFAVWNVIYQFYYILTGVYSELNWKGIIVQAIKGPYHFWYIYMLVGVYLLIPFLRKITESKKLMEYFLILFLLFELLINYGTMLPIIGDIIETVLNYISFHFALGYTGYFVAGYYFYKYPVSKRLEKILYAFGIMFLFGAAGFTVLNSVWQGIHDDWFTAYLMPNVAIESFAIYTFFIKKVARWNFKPYIMLVIEKMSEYSFGIYCIHALVIGIFGHLGLSPVAASPFIMVPLLAVLFILASGIVSSLIRKIPVIGTKII